MVTIFIITQNAQGQSQVFSFFSQLERALDMLSYIRHKGEAVTQAYVIDQGQRLDLPIDIFDGQSFSVPIQGLKRQWEGILSKPSSKLSLHSLALIEFYNRQIKTLLQHKQVAEQSLIRAQQLHQQNLSSKARKTVRLRLIDDSENSIIRYELQLTWLDQQLKSTQCHRLELIDQLGS